MSADLLRRALNTAPGSPTRGTVVFDAARARVVHPGGAIEFARRRVVKELLLALAAAGGDVVPKEALARTLFARYEPGRHDAILRVNLGRLRATLRAAGIGVAFKAGGYYLVTPPGFVYARPDGG
ncbi:MAG: hypothetical protein JNL79_40715 [Myxococcales bacterium]|nr:hypothetical protein [Myxococcales bacterium]